MKDKEKLCIMLLKYVPVISALFMLLHVITLMYGHCVCIYELSTISIVSIMIIVWSHIFKFCIIHKIASLYVVAVLWCCYIQRFIGFGKYVDFIRESFIYIGVSIFTAINIKYFYKYLIIWKVN